MIRIVTVSQMRAIDAQAIGGDPAIGYSYMVKAGAALAAEAKVLVPDPLAGNVAIVCGKGNNGGDGYVAASLLMDAGYKTMCFGLCSEEELKGEAKMAFNEYAGRKGSFMLLDDPADLENLKNYVLTIDAILGTGISGSVHGFPAEVIEEINALGVPVLSVDTPSGLDNDTGRVTGACVKAAATVSMGFAKIGQFYYPGRGKTGRLLVEDLGYPEILAEQHSSNIWCPEKSDIAPLMPQRKPAGSKFDHGQVLALAGSRGMAGSACLACEAALRTGCGMVHAAVPSGILDILAAKLTETVLHPVAQTNEGSASVDAFSRIAELLEKKQCLVVGPGLSHNSQTAALVRKLTAASTVPVVLDADGINAYKGAVDELKGHRADVLLTPHAGEWARLFGELPPDPMEAITVIRHKATSFNVTVIYKGSPTIIAVPRGRAYLMPYGTSALATAGSGDVLTGILSSLIAQGCSVSDAAILGVYLHGRAGTLAAEELTDYGVVAGDVVKKIPAAIKELLL